MIDISEIFYSIQGESSLAGFPCIFIRFAGCNLLCSYCDTTYSYKTEASFSVKEILEEIQKFSPVKLVEITGGEPLLQNDIYKLFSCLQQADYQIMLETNGSIRLNEVPEFVTKIVDVKCPSSGEGGSFLMENLHYLNKKDELKFVICDREDFEWALDFISQNKLEGKKILFSAVTAKLQPQILAEWILKKKLNFRLQLQLQKYIWGDQRGV